MADKFTEVTPYENFENDNEVVNKNVKKQVKSNKVVDSVKSESPLPGGLDSDTKRLYHIYKNEERVEVAIAPMYAPYFGQIQTITINGISIKVPCNGSKIAVPKTFAAEIERRMANVNNRIKREQAMSKNAIFESSPGEAVLF